MLVVPFVMKNGFNKPFVKMHRLLGYYLQTHPGGPFYMGLAPVRNTPSGIGSRPSMTCGRTSAITSRRQPANCFSTRRLHIVSAFLMRRLLVA
jgi:hypothetical protein